ncbi:MAG: FIST N-terminal domain-containing protein, partial [Acidobacteriota bacterium]
MRSRVIHPRSGPRSGDALIERARSRLAGEPGADPARPDLVCGFLPPGDLLQPTLDAMAEAWPESLRLGCEAVTQFADGAMTSGGSLQLFWFEHAGHRAEVIAVGGTVEAPPDDPAIDRVAALVAEGDPVLILADGLRFPAESFLDRLRARLAGGENGGEAGRSERTERGAPRVVGGLASQAEPIAALGARVFLGRDVLEAGCLVVALRGLAMEVEIVRGWDPASPSYTVTAAEGDVLHAIDGEPATDWFRRFFTIEGKLAPLPESAYRFPLIVDGPKPERRNLYRSMKRFDEPPGAVTFWGGIEVGDRIRL